MMQSSILPEPISIQHLLSHSDILDHLYSQYCDLFLIKENRPLLFEKFIYVESKKVDNKADSFWHIASLSTQESTYFNILPCNNDSSKGSCPDNCLHKLNTVVLLNKMSRDICYYRGSRLNWIPAIITLANNQDPRVKVWIKNNKLHLRFIHESVDYILILQQRFKNNRLTHFNFISAFPVFYINKKRDYDTDYSAYHAQHLAIGLI